MPRPPLAPSVRVQPGVDVVVVWEAFERFEALHHLMQIMNPLSSDALGEVLEPVGLVDTTPADWHDYQARILSSAEAWAADHPGERAAEYLADQRRWAADNANAAELIG